MSGTVPHAERASASAGRVQDIARQIRGAALPFLGTDASRKDAADASQLAATHHTNNREGIMSELALLSQAGQWSSGEVKGAAKIAADMSAKIETEKAMATFIGECKRAMHPKVRAYVSDMIAVRDLAWEAERAAYAEDKDTPTPLKKAFSRGYHCLIAMFGETEENSRVFDSVGELLAFAAERDPDLDLDKVKKRLARIRDQLAGFYADWPVDDIQVCIDALNEVDAKALRNARPSEPKQPKTQVAAPVTAHEEPAAEELNEEDPEADQSEDLTDILADVLGETHTHAMAA